MAIKEEKTLLIAMPESTYGADAILAALGSTPSPFAAAAILAGNLDITGTGDALERSNYSPSLSADTTGVGRVGATLTFTTELRASGVLGKAPRIGTLFKGAACSETIITAGLGQISNALAGEDNVSAAAATIVSGMVKTTPPATVFDFYRATFTTGGAPATAKFMLTALDDPTLLNSLDHSSNVQSLGGVVTIGGTVPAPVFTFSGTWALLDVIELFVGGVRFYYQVQAGDSVTTIATAFKTLMLADARFVGTNNAAGVLTVGLSVAAGETATSAGAQAVNLGSSGAVIGIPVWTGALVAGEAFEVSLQRVGVHYDPITDNQTSISFWVLMDGNLHRMLGARGTATMDGQAAQYPTITWTFTGIYYDPVEYAIPQGVRFEKSKPYKVELSELTLTGLSANRAKAQSFQMDLGNEVSVNDNINAREAYDEIEIVDRTSTMGCNPEAVKVGVYSPWARMRKGDTTVMKVAGGTLGGPGNIWRLQANRANYTGAPYAARNKRRAYTIGLRLARRTGDGNDEFRISFM